MIRQRLLTIIFIQTIFIVGSSAFAGALSLADLNKAEKQGQLLALVESEMIRSENYEDRKLLRKLVLNEDDEVIAALTSLVFPKIHQLGIKYDIIRAASYFAEVDARAAFLKKARSLESKGRQSELEELLGAYLNPHPPKKAPPGYQLMREFLGKGKYSYVSLVRDNTTGQLYAWKRKTGTPANKGDAFRKHLNLFYLWQAMGLTDGEMMILVGPNKEESILHSFVNGKTLKQLYFSDNFFLNIRSAEFKSLVQLFVVMIKNHIVLLDLNTKNIVYDGTRWQVIDSQRPELMGSAQEAYDRFEVVISKKWSSSSNQLAKPDVQLFFKALLAELKKDVFLKDNQMDAAVSRLAKEVLAKHNTGQIIKQGKVIKCKDLISK